MLYDILTARSAWKQRRNEHAAAGVVDPAEPIAGPRIMFMYWGRRGLSRFVRELMAATGGTPCAEATLSLSRQNEEFASFVHLGARLCPVDTFTSSHGAITEAWRIPPLRRHLAEWLRYENTDVVIDLMPHVWSPFLIPAIQGAGARYICVLHDAVGHPGDRSGLVTQVLRRAAYRADHVVALSRTVGDRLLATSRLRPDRLTVLFHPRLSFAVSQRQRQPPAPSAPLRLLFLGRIMSYKGLPLFLDAVDRLRADGVPVSPGVFGEGSIAPYTRRMTEMGVELVNRRLTDAEVGDVLLRFDALVASHVEASQSGVVAAALGAGLPCVVTPVGGLLEQIVDGETGTIARDTTATALGNAVRRLFFTPNLYSTICRIILQRQAECSMSRFLMECARVAGADAGAGEFQRTSSSMRVAG
jgi:glycosyltransferase involved in cell wall biosynthesis